MTEWWLSSFFKDKCDSGKDGRKPLDEYLKELKGSLTKDDVNNKQKLKEDLEDFIGGYIEIVYRDNGVSINAYDVIRDINIPEITDLRMISALYFKFKGVDCSVVPDGRLFVY